MGRTVNKRASAGRLGPGRVIGRALAVAIALGAAEAQARQESDGATRAATPGTSWIAELLEGGVPRGLPRAGGAGSQPEADGADAPSPVRGTDEDGSQDAGPDGASASHVNVDENELVELHVRDEDLRTVLHMLAMQSQRSIVSTDEVNASVTANIYGKTFEQTLDAILLYNGFGYIEEGDTIFVMPIDEIRRIERESRQPITRVMHLDYLNAVDAASFAQPLLSEDGTITTNGETPEFNVSGNVPVGKDDYPGISVLVIHDYPERIAEIEALIAELDTRPSQVLVQSTILQSTINESNAFGVDFSIIGDLDFKDFTPLGGPLRAVDGLITGGNAGEDSGGGADDGGTVTSIPDDGEGRGVSSTVGNTGRAGGFKIGIVQDDVAAFIRMLDEVSDTTIVSNPKVLTLNRQPARVQVGRRIGFLSTTTTETSTSETVEFLDTGTQLYFRPFVTNDGFIRMELRPEVSQPFIREVTNATGAALTIPDEDTSHLVTNVLVRDGQTIVLGGLFTERTVANRRQVPVVGDVPIIGTAFRGHDDSVQRSEIIFLVTPTVVSDDILLDQGERAQAHVEHLRAGSREGLLPWSREKRSAQLLVQAERLADDGKTRAALNKVRRSLQLNPAQPEAIRLRERLATEPSIWPSRSMLEQIINEEAARRLDRARRSEPEASRAPDPLGEDQP